jgi:molecular chaperone GrpE
MHWEGPATKDSDAVSRALRELDAAKARVERDAKAVEDETRRRLIAQLLPLLDDLDRTIQAARDQGDAPTVVDGVELVRNHLEAVLRGYGVERVDTVAQRFDPRLHDAVAVREVADAKSHDVVIDQLQPCYRWGGTLLRPAKVVVGRAATPPR